MNHFHFLATLDEAAMREWNEPARTHYFGEFTVAGFAMPEYLARRTRDGEYEKVAIQFTTVRDLRHDAIFKMRNVGEDDPEANAAFTAFEAALARAGGNLNAKLIDLADPKEGAD